MADDAPPKSKKDAAAELAVISNRLAVAFAKREALVKSWTASSVSKLQKPPKTQEEIDAEDALLFRPEPAHLGVGAAIPSHFLVSQADQNNKSLRSKFFPKGLKASKARDLEEKAASAKRGYKADSSDEEEGRSGLGKAKKAKTIKESTEIEKTAAVLEHVGGDEDRPAKSRTSKKNAAKPVKPARENPLVQAMMNGSTVAESKRQEEVITASSISKAFSKTSVSQSPHQETDAAKETKQEESLTLSDLMYANKTTPKLAEGTVNRDMGVTDPKELKRLRRREKKKKRRQRDRENTKDEKIAVNGLVSP